MLSPLRSGIGSISRLVSVLLLSASALFAEEPVFPGRTWAERTPAQAGMDADALARFRAVVGGRGCVVRGGTLIYSWGDVAKRADVASAAKPVYVHLLLQHIEQGNIKSLDDPIRTWEPRLDNRNAALGFKDRGITWRHLANQTSCYGVQEPPGAAYDYSDYNMALLVDTLFLRVGRSSYAGLDADILHPRLTHLLQCQDDPTFLAFGTKNRPGRLAISVRDFCRFGLLYRHQGQWKGKQLLTAENARRAVSSPVPNTVPRTEGKMAEMLPNQRSIGGGNNQTDHLGSYSFAWWINGIDRQGKRHWPDAPPDTFAALGHGGVRALVVIPSLDLMVSWNDARIRDRDGENQALKLLTGAVLKK